ncbi:hypothetical protein ACP8HI_13555 [Paenibacillus sp. FA6]|uniref:hypothetical protein n=1 Tax=Paenibacillus sp. FA6 TaxID=3413029 RepID=UPI003F65E7E1
MSLWNDSPRLKSPPQTEDISVILNYVKNLANTVAMMAKDLEFILNGNVAFDNIRTNGIEAKNIKAESITTDKIQAGAVIAEKIDVGELSAISANMGKLTSGEIYGAYIATKENAYPRAEMSNLENLFAAFLDARNYISVEANYSGSPSLNFIQDGAIKGRLQTLMGSLGIDSIGSLDLGATGSINISPGGTNTLTIPSFGRVMSSTGQNLGLELDRKASASESGYNLAFDNATRNLKMFSRTGDLLAQVNIP